MKEVVSGTLRARKIKRLRISPYDLGIIYSMNGMLKIESKLPPTARMVSIHQDVKEDCLWLFYECRDFELVKEGDITPELPWDTVTLIDEGMNNDK